LLTCVCSDVYCHNSNETSRVFPSKYFALISLLSLTGLIVGVVGAVLAVDDDGSYSINGLVKAALAFFITTFSLMLATLVALAMNVQRSQENKPALGTETRILAAVGLAAPFLLVRLVYASIADYNGDPRFNYFNGNDTIYLCMGVLVELIVTTICLITGFFVPLPPRFNKATSPEPEQQQPEQ